MHYTFSKYIHFAITHTTGDVNLGNGVIYPGVVLAKSHLVIRGIWQLLFVALSPNILGFRRMQVTASLYLIPVFGYGSIKLTAVSRN